MLNNPTVLFTISFLIISIPFIQKRPYNAIRLLVIMLFTKLVFLKIGVPVTSINIIVDGTVGIMFLSVINITRNKNQKFRTPGLIVFGLFTFVVFISVLTNNVESFFDAFSFYRHLLVAYMFFLIALNLPFSVYQLFKLISLLKGLFVLQFIGAVIKLIFIGLSEEYVGLMELSAGSLNAIFPLIGIAFLVSLHFVYKKVKYLGLYILGLLFIGVVGIKRGFFAFLPLELFFFYFLYLKYKKNSKFPVLRLVSTSPVIALVLIIVIIAGISLTPAFNREKKVGGNVDLEYAFESSKSHNMGSDKSKYAKGRIGSTLTILEEQTTDFKLTDIFGNGAGMFVGKDNTTSNIRQYNVAVLTILPSFARQLIQIGLAGSAMVIFFYIFMIRLSWKRLKFSLHPLLKAIAISNIIIGAIFLYDYLLYSPVTYSTYISAFFFYFFTGILLNKNINKGLLEQIYY